MLKPPNFLRSFLWLPLLAAAPFTIAGAQEGGGRLAAHWTFDEGAGQIARDATGNTGHNCVLSAGQWVRGAVGNAYRFSGRAGPQLPSAGDLTPGRYLWTVAVWVRTAARNGVIYGYGRADVDHMTLSIKGGRAAFEIDKGEGSNTVYSRRPVNDGRWHRIVGMRTSANGVRLYVDGVREDERPDGPEGTRIEWEDTGIRVGSLGGATPFNGEMDDLRVYDYVLPELDVRRLSQLPRAAPTRSRFSSRRGPGAATAQAQASKRARLDALLAEVGEQPNIEQMLAVIEVALIKDTDAKDATAVSRREEALKRAGLYKPKPTAPQPAARAGLLGFWNFLQLRGDGVPDTSSVQPAVNLRPTRPDAVRRDAATGGIEIVSPCRIRSEGPASKLTSRIRRSNSFSAEIWFKPANLKQGGPARIFTLSKDGSNCNFTVAQDGSKVVFRLRTTGTSKVGTPSTDTPSGALTGGLVHVICTFDGSVARVYVDGRLAAERRPGGSLSNWSDYVLCFANEVEDRRDWLGTILAAAVHGRALSATEVRTSFQAGQTVLKSARAAAGAQPGLPPAGEGDGPGAPPGVDGTAVVSIGGAGRFLADTLRERAPLYGTGRLLFRRIPSQLEGLQYVHYRNRPKGALTVTVLFPGKLYAILPSGSTPRELGGGGRVWTRLSSVIVMDRWPVYVIDVKAGETITLRQPRRGSVFIVARQIASE